jgi:hypothetical protein
MKLIIAYCKPAMEPMSTAQRPSNRKRSPIMKSFHLMLVMALSVLSGCAESSALIRTGSESLRGDVFQELKGGGLVPKGEVELRISSSLKTHKPGTYQMETRAHGTSSYRMLVNIDGQALQLEGNPQPERTGSDFGDPEGGDGTRYRFSKSVRLKPGTHKIIMAFPDDGVAVTRELTLVDGSSNCLVVKPVYGAIPERRRSGFYGVTSFKEGLKGVRLVLDGRAL